VFHSRWNPDNISLSDLLDRASPLLNPARAGGDDQDLTERVRVPCTPRAGLERNLPAACDIAARPSDVLELVISSYRAKKSQRRLATQDSLSLICSTGFVNFWTGMPFAST